MALSAGDRLGPYEVVAKIGEGGMGEVYRARDTQLERDVAVKVLPEAFTADRTRLLRFEREAKALASLNHSHIAHIYGVVEAHGQRALVLEFVDGPTLADLVAAGPIPLRESLDIARQIAEALEAAHEAGVIHRDLKPANIKVRPDGTVKILDFGLAKAIESTRGGESRAPTLGSTAVAGTQVGMIVGTVAYMSPEQAHGRSVDKRTDVWAFGAVLFEMLTGTRAFKGDDLTDTIAAVIRGDPDWSALPSDVPLLVRRLLARCLAKDRRNRIHDIADARIEIVDALVAPPETAGAHGGAHPSRWQLGLPWAVAAAAMIAAIGIWWGTEQPPLQRPIRLTVSLPDGQELPPEWVNPLDVSRDGQFVVYAARPREGEGSRLFVRAIGAFGARSIDGTDGAEAPFFSPDGDWIGFFANGALWKVPRSGGRPFKICDVQMFFPGATWGEGDVIIFVDQRFGLFRVSANGGAPEQLTRPDAAAGEVRHLAPQRLPGGRRLLFTVMTDTQPFAAVLSLDSSESRPLVRNAGAARYLESGHLLYFQSGSLVVAAFDPETLEVRGSPIPIQEQVSYHPTLGVARFAVSATGTLVYAPADAWAGDTTMVWVDRTGAVQPLGAAPADFSYPRISPDGRQIAVSITPHLWLYDADRGTGLPLTTSGINVEPVWTPDGARVTFSRTTPGTYFDLYNIPADRSGPPELLLQREGRQLPTSWSPDGRTLAFYERTDSGEMDIWMLEGTRARALLAENHIEHSPVLSPDGPWLAYVSFETGTAEVHVRPYPGPGRARIASIKGGTQPLWSRNGRELFYRSGDVLMAVAVESRGSELALGTPTPLFQGRFDYGPGGSDGDGGGLNYDVTPDGARFVMLQLPEARSSQIHVVTDWFSELTGRAPVD